MRFIKNLSPRAVGISAAAITIFIWTFFIVVARATTDPARGATMLPLDIVMARIIGAAFVLLPWGWWLVRRDRQQGNQQVSSLFGFSPLPLKITVLIGLFGGVLYGMLAYSGFVYAPAAHASVLMPGSLPLWTSLLAVVILREHLTRNRIISLLLIVAGDLLVGGSSLLKAFEGGEVWKGDVLFMVAAFGWSAYTVMARKFALDAVRATIAITVFAAMTYIPVYGVLMATQSIPSKFLTAPVGDILFQMIFQGVGSVVISGITFTKMIQYFGPVRSTMFTAIVPGSSALGAVLLLGEPLSVNLWAGLALVTVGILFGVRNAKPVLPLAGAVPSQR
jgi:drug/metabolite transporter (DMT)-like permease